MKGELRQTMAQGSGAITNCSSIGGMRGPEGRATYSARKFGIVGNTPMAVKVTKNNDSDIVKAFVAAETEQDRPLVVIKSI